MVSVWGAGLGGSLWGVRLEVSGFGFYHTESVYKVVLQKSIPHESVNLFFILVIMKDSLTDLWGDGPVQNDFAYTFCEIRSDRVRGDDVDFDRREEAC